MPGLDRPSVGSDAHRIIASEVVVRHLLTWQPEGKYIRRALANRTHAQLSSKSGAFTFASLCERA